MSELFGKTKDLVHRCLQARRDGNPFLESESVLADWAEETGLLGLAAWLRGDIGNLRWYALSQTWQMLTGEIPSSESDKMVRAREAAAQEALRKETEYRDAAARRDREHRARQMRTQTDPGPNHWRRTNDDQLDALRYALGREQRTAAPLNAAKARDNG